MLGEILSLVFLLLLLILIVALVTRWGRGNWTEPEGVAPLYQRSGVDNPVPLVFSKRMGLSNSVIPPVLPPARVMGAAERDAYKTARYAGNVGRSTMYVAPVEGTRYKVYPLCCPECRAHAEGELALLTRAQCCPRVAQLLGVWETREHPENNSKTDYPYLVLALEATTPIADPKVTALDWPLFRATVETAEELSKEAGREIDQSFATIQNSRRGPVLAHLDHPRAPKSMITKCLDPALFGTAAAEYTTWAQARVKK